MSSFITLSQATAMTQAYQNMKEQILHSQYQKQDLLAICETFDYNDVRAILNNPDCKAVRVYYGMDEDNKVHAIMVGVNDNDEDILPPGVEAGQYLLENARRCPLNCPPTSSLNS